MSFPSSQSFLVSLSQSIGLALFAAGSGALASRALGVASSWLTLMAALVLVGALAAVWHVIAKVPWAASAMTWHAWTLGEPLPSLPYAQGNSDAAHLAANLGQFRAWVSQVFAPRYLGLLLIGFAAALVVMALAAVLAASSGAQVAAIAILALVASQVAVVLCKGYGRPHAFMQGLVLVAAMFTIGYGAFAPLSLAVVCIAVAFAAIAASIAHNSTLDRTLQWVGFSLGLGTMIVTHLPVGAFVLGVMWLPQVLLPRVSSPRVHVGWLLVGMLASALVLAS